MHRVPHLRFAAAPAAGAHDHALRAEALGFDAVLVADGDAPAAMAATTRVELIDAGSLSVLRGSPVDGPPAVYTSGADEPDRADADLWILDGRPAHEVRRRIAQARGIPRPAALAPLRFGLSALVVARETEAEAAIALARAWERDDRSQRPPAFGSPQADLYRRFPHVGARGGTAAGLVGSYDTVARRIRELRDLHIELLVLELLPATGESDGGLARFAREVVPRVQRPQAVAVGRETALAAVDADARRRERHAAIAV
jgi:hypothetical protein